MIESSIDKHKNESGLIQINNPQQSNDDFPRASNDDIDSESIEDIEPIQVQ